MSISVPAAALTKQESYRIVGGLHITDRWFRVPLDYAQPHGTKIQIFARSAAPEKSHDGSGEKLPICLYLQGGPGFECTAPKAHPLTEFFHGKGMQMLYLDQRGTGLSTPIDADVVTRGRTVEEQAAYLKCFRADNIVRDCEAIRKTLLMGRKEEEDRKWTVHGQSFGGFCAVTYLSFYPEGLKEVFTTGGMPPLINNPDAVYTRTYRQLSTRNRVYYTKYPQDVAAVHRITSHLASTRIQLPGPGYAESDPGYLTPSRFLDLGISFGGHGGIDAVHRLVQRAANDLELHGRLTHKVLAQIQSQQSFDGNPLYAVLHESIYCQGEPSNWSARRLIPEPSGPSDPSDPSSAAQFTGEMVYPEMFDCYAGLRPLKLVAELLAAESDWPPLYDREQLARNSVPVFAANYIDDMYVAYELARETVDAIRGAKSYDTNALMHNAVRARTETVMGELWRLRAGEVD